MIVIDKEPHDGATIDYLRRLFPEAPHRDAAWQISTQNRIHCQTVMRTFRPFRP